MRNNEDNANLYEFASISLGRSSLDSVFHTKFTKKVMLFETKQGWLLKDIHNKKVLKMVKPLPLS